MYSTYSRAYTTVKNVTLARHTIGRAYEQAELGADILPAKRQR